MAASAQAPARIKIGAPAFIELGQRAIILAQRLPPLGIGLGVDQIGDGLGAGQVELAVLDRAAGELAGFGRPKTKRTQRRNTASTVARPPWIWNSATSSPVKLAGAAK